MAEEFCVGESNCSFKMVISAMKNAPTFENIVDHWRKISLDLELGKDVVNKIERKVVYEGWSAFEVINEILESWRLSIGTDAKLDIFFDTLEKFKLNDILLELRKKFYPDEASRNQQLNTQLQACVYIRMPTGLPILLPGQVTTIPIQYGLTSDFSNLNFDNGLNSKQALSSITELDIQARVLKDPKYTSVSVKIEKHAKREDDFYKLPGIESGNGYALILNIIRYEEQGYRQGAQYDSLVLTQLFTQLGYQVVKYDDPHFYYTKNDIKRIIEVFRAYIVARNPASVVVFIGCHGQMEQIVLSDVTLTSLFTSIVYQFDASNCPSLKNIPKIFISNSCRDEHTYEGPAFSNIFNTIICYSAVAGKQSFRDIYQGSHCINSLVKVFAENAYRLNLSELLELTQQDLWSKEIEFGNKGYCKQQCMYVKLGGFKTFYFNM